MTKLKVVGECVRCGNCCKYAGLFNYVKKDKTGIFRPKRRSIDLARECGSFNNNLCNIHDKKPKICADWPFFPHEPAMVGCKVILCCLWIQ